MRPEIKIGVELAENMAKDMKPWRDKLKWTQERMADEVGISREWYVKTEAGEVPCKRTTALSFAYVVLTNL